MDLSLGLLAPEMEPCVLCSRPAEGWVVLLYAQGRNGDLGDGF